MTNNKVIGVFSLAMINAAAIINLNNLPSLVVLGYGLISYLVLAAVFFFLPTALVSAELSTGWRQEGGFYMWVRIAYGPIISFLAIWLQWIANVIWYPTLIAPIVVNGLLLFSPALSHRPWVLFILMIGIFWALTFTNFRGIRSASLVSVIGVLLGSILPAILFIVFAGIWLAHKLPVDLTFHAQALMPKFNHLSDLSILMSILVTLVGMEMSAVHTNNVINPSKTYPRAILISTILILATFAVTSFAMAILVPPNKIDLINGVLQCLESFTQQMGVPWMLKPIMALIILGVLAMASTWILGPSRGLHIAAINDEFPSFFQHKNKNQMPTRILLLQAIIYSILSLLLVFAPSIESSYWVLIALTGQLYMVMYFILFCTGIKLRIKYPQVIRAYTIPGKNNIGMFLVASIGILGTIGAFIITFFPPEQFTSLSSNDYVPLLATLFIVFCILPLVIFSLYYLYRIRHADVGTNIENSDLLLIETERLPVEFEESDHDTVGLNTDEIR